MTLSPSQSSCIVNAFLVTTWKKKIEQKKWNIWQSQTKYESCIISCETLQTPKHSSVVEQDQSHDSLSTDSQHSRSFLYHWHQSGRLWVGKYSCSYFSPWRDSPQSAFCKRSSTSDSWTHREAETGEQWEETTGRKVTRLHFGSITSLSVSSTIRGINRSLTHVSQTAWLHVAVWKSHDEQKLKVITMNSN